MKNKLIYCLIIFLAVLLTGCIQPTPKGKTCEELSGFICSEKEFCSEGFLEASDSTNCCVSQCQPKKEISLVEKAFKGQGSFKCELTVEGVKAIVLLKDLKFNLDFNESKILSDYNFYYEFSKDLNAWLKIDKKEQEAENDLWEKIQSTALSNPEKVSCIEQSLEDNLFFVPEKDLFQLPINGGNGGETPGDSDSNKQVNPIKACDELENPLKREVCIKDLALQSLQTNVCRKLSIFSKDSCINEIAVKTNKLDLCNEIENELRRNECIKIISINLNEITACNAITDENRTIDCYYRIGLQKKILDSCLKISPTSYGIFKRDECIFSIATEQKNVDLCNLISLSYVSSEFTRDKCFFSLVEKIEDISFCNKIIDLNRRNECLKLIGVTQFRLDACQAIDVNSLQGECIKSIALNDANHLVCLEIPQSELPLRQECFSEIAVKTQSIDLCYKIYNTDLKGDCLKNLALVQKQVVGCEKITFNDKKKFECYYEFALQENNPSYCEDTGIVGLKNLSEECYYTLATKNQNISLCEKILVDKTYYNCFLDIAVELKSHKICPLMKKIYLSNITKYPISQLCIKDFAAKTSDKVVCDEIISQELREACLKLDLNFT